LGFDRIGRVEVEAVAGFKFAFFVAGTDFESAFDDVDKELVVLNGERLPIGFGGEFADERLDSFLVSCRCEGAEFPLFVRVIVVKKRGLAVPHHRHWALFVDPLDEF